MAEEDASKNQRRRPCENEVWLDGAPTERRERIPGASALGERQLPGRGVGDRTPYCYNTSKGRKWHETCDERSLGNRGIRSRRTLCAIYLAAMCTPSRCPV